MTNERLKIKLKAMIARRAGKAYMLLTADELEQHKNALIKDLKLIESLTSK